MLKQWLSAIALVAGASQASATPLSMQYVKTALGGGQFQYDFVLTLDNRDGSWRVDDEWDWIVFGANDYGGGYRSFDANGGLAAGLDWTTTRFSAPITEVRDSGGAVNGPTLWIDGGVDLPGWKPTALGQSLSWSGTSGVDIGDGAMRWSVLAVGGQAIDVQFALATQVTSVPEPATLGMALLGLGVLVAKARRPGRSVPAVSS